jgi:hypothetical protein
MDTLSRLKVTNPTTVLSTFSLGDTPWKRNAVVGVQGSGIWVKESPYAYVRMRVANATISGSVVYQSRCRSIYRMGKTIGSVHKFKFFDPVTNSVQRVGHYDNTDGLYIKMVTGGPSFVRRSSTGASSMVEETILRKDWNNDKLDGTGPSGKVIDFTKVQTLVIDYDYTSGTSNFGFDLDGEVRLAHYIMDTNAFVESRINNPNLPLRVEMSSPTLTDNMYYYGAAVMVNDGYTGGVGRPKTIDGSFASSATASNLEVCSIRIASKNVKYSAIKFSKLSAFSSVPGCTGIFTVSVNASFPSGTPTWTQYEDNNSVVERNTGAARTASVLGYLLASGCAASHTDVIAEPVENGARNMLGAGIPDSSNPTGDVLSLTFSRPNSTPCTFYYTMEWLEYY